MQLLTVIWSLTIFALGTIHVNGTPTRKDHGIDPMLVSQPQQRMKRQVVELGKSEAADCITKCAMQAIKSTNPEDMKNDNKWCQLYSNYSGCVFETCGIELKPATLSTVLDTLPKECLGRYKNVQCFENFYSNAADTFKCSKYCHKVGSDSSFDAIRSCKLDCAANAIKWINATMILINDGIKCTISDYLINDI